MLTLFKRNIRQMGNHLVANSARYLHISPNKEGVPPLMLPSPFHAFFSVFGLQSMSRYHQIASDANRSPIVSLPARFRAVDHYARAKNVSGAAFPNFNEREDHEGRGLQYGVQFLRKEAVKRRKVLASELGNPQTDIALLKAIADYSQLKGFACGFPNFHQENDHHGHGVKYGVLLIKRGYAEWKYVLASELGNPQTVEEQFRAVDSYARNSNNQYIYAAAFPGFHSIDYGDGQGMRIGVWLIMKNAVQLQDVPVKDLEDAMMSIPNKEESKTSLRR